MRVTNRMIIDSVVRSISRNFERLQEIQESIASGKDINKPSDDPLGAARVLDYRETLSRIDGYTRSIGWARRWLEFTDSSLGQADALLIRAKEIAISQSSGTADKMTRAVAAAEVEQLFQQMLQIANVKLNRRYLFAGQRTDAEPFASDGTYKGDAGEVRVVIGPGMDMGINSSGDKVFEGGPTGEKIFALLQGLKTALEADDPVAVGNTLPGLDAAQEQVSMERASAGTRLNRLDVMEESLADLNLNTEKLLSETEGADLAKAVMELAQRRNLYQASLAVVSGIIQPTLLDFLR